MSCSESEHISSSVQRLGRADTSSRLLMDAARPNKDGVAGESGAWGMSGAESQVSTDGLNTGRARTGTDLGGLCLFRGRGRRIRSFE
jgi:hypothetical protein